MTGTRGTDFGAAILFCPADRADRFQKAADRSDSVVLDLEDAVSAESRDRALVNIVESTLDPAHTLVRVRNSPLEDAEPVRAALRIAGYRAVVLPKCDSAAQIDEWSEFDVVAQIESAAGVLAAASIAAHPAVIGLSWGAEDLATSIGASSSVNENGEYRDPIRVARATILLAASAFGTIAIDAPYSSFADADGQRRIASDAAGSGFSASFCVHPAQVSVIRDAYRPGEDEISTALEVVALANRSSGALRMRDTMVDLPVVLRAERTLARAGRSAL